MFGPDTCVWQDRLLTNVVEPAASQIYLPHGMYTDCSPVYLHIQVVLTFLGNVLAGDRSASLSPKKKKRRKHQEAPTHAPGGQPSATPPSGHTDGPHRAVANGVSAPPPKAAGSKPATEGAPAQLQPIAAAAAQQMLQPHTGITALSSNCLMQRSGYHGTQLDCLPMLAVQYTKLLCKAVADSESQFWQYDRA